MTRDDIATWPASGDPFAPYAQPDAWWAGIDIATGDAAWGRTEDEVRARLEAGRGSRGRS